MITLFGAGPQFGLPDPSPFVTKVEVLLKMADLAYRNDPSGFGKAPKKKIPFIDDDGVIVPDSTFIRLYLEKKYGIDFDAGLSPADRAIAWAFEKLCEDHLYWAMVYERWTDDTNFNKGPRLFFARVPAPLRGLVVAMVRRKVRNALYASGMGRHTPSEVETLAFRDLDAIAAFLGDKPWLMGEAPCGADATLFAFLAGVLCPWFETAVRRAGESHANLVRYRDRGMKRWFPELAA
jgi:glutathione S-transferase